MGNRLSGKLLPSVGVVLILSSGTTVSSIEMAAVAFLLWLNQDLATITLDRIFDGIVFLGFTAIVLAFYPFTDQSEILKSGISWGALTSLGLFAVLIALLVGFQYALKKEDGDILSLIK